jgi:hypothetical protein
VFVMATIVLVHGIDQQQRSADALESEWIPALAGGVRLAGFPGVADGLWRDRSGPGAIETRMAFYGHLFLRPDVQGDDPGELTPAEQAFAEQLAEEWLRRAAEQASRPDVKQTASRELAYVRQQVGDQEQGIGAVLRSAINGVVRVKWFAPSGMAFAERFVNRALAQVTRYLSDEEVRRTALQAVTDLIDRNTKVVIGHSLGSVVAYEAMHQIGHSLPLLITIGSPLGLETIIYPKLRPQPPDFPPVVQRWVNVADRDDFIAAAPDLRTMFSRGIPAKATFERSYTVDNGAKPHEAKFYLAKMELGKPIGELLSALR